MSAKPKMKNLKDINVSFNLRTPSQIEKDSAVKCVLRWNNNTLTLYSVAKINPKRFDRKKQRAKNNGKSMAWDSSSFNHRLDDIEGRIKKLFRDYLNDHNEYPNFDAFKAIIDEHLTNKKTATSDSLLQYFDSYIEKSKARFNEHTQKLLTPAIIKSYRRTLGILKEYRIHIRKRDISFTDVTLSFYNDLTTFMQTELDLSINTIGTHFRNLKTVLNAATEEGINKSLEYKKKAFRSHKVDVENIFLTIEELERIQNLDLLRTPHLDNARDLFLVGCWTGLRFSDFSKLEKSNFKNGTIEVLTQKTQKKVTIPILRPLQAIIDKYTGYTENSLPKSISNQKLNDYIKIVGEKAEINELYTIETIKGGKMIRDTKPKYQLITTHTARRSFASNMYIKGAPSISIMQITGHTTERSFLKYIKLEANSHAEIIRAFYG